MTGCHIDAADEQFWIDDAVIQFTCDLQNFFGGGGMSAEISRSVSVLRGGASVSVGGGFSGVAFIGSVITDGQHDLIGDKILVYQVKYQKVGHLPHNQLRFLSSVRLLQNLTGTDAVRFRLVCLDFLDRARFPAPGMVDQQLRIDAEHLVKKVLVVEFMGLAHGTFRNVAHSVDTDFLQL